MDGPGRRFPVSPQFESAGMTRRDVLRGLAAGSAALAGVPLVARYGTPARPRRPQRGDGSGGRCDADHGRGSPVSRNSDRGGAGVRPGLKAYAEAIQPWLDENPGVKLEQITFDVYDQEALLVAISGGTAPSFYPADVLGRMGRRAGPGVREVRARRRRHRPGRAERPRSEARRLLPRALENEGGRGPALRVAVRLQLW